jgi:hypothetical protein
MMLTGASLTHSEEFFTEVVRHETGHTLGFTHENLRPELVGQIDPEKAIKYKEVDSDDEWDEDKTRHNVLTPLVMDQHNATGNADVHSIMCYTIPNSILKRGAAPITGGKNFSDYDKTHAASIYRKPRVHSIDVSTDEHTSAIAASGSSLYKVLFDGQIQISPSISGKVNKLVAFVQPLLICSYTEETAKIGQFDLDKDGGITDWHILTSANNVWQHYAKDEFTIIKEWQGGPGIKLDIVGTSCCIYRFYRPYLEVIV